MAGKGSKPGERRGGRALGTPNKATADIKALAQKHAPAAMEFAAKLVNGPHGENGPSYDTRLRAAQFLVERGYGRPIQAIEGTGTNGAILLEFKGFE